MTITVTKNVDDNTKIINSANGVGGETEQVLVDVLNSSNATSEPKVSVANINYDILGTGTVTVYFKSDITKKVELTSRGNYGLKPSETSLRKDINIVGDILLDSDANVNSYIIVIECQKIGGYNG
tara:strand:+ start:397 stop:771 length:375 start_codon:yes stop_codon:yes gene_type:complete